MTFGRGRPRRPDDWPSGHVRARAAISERLDAPLEPTEARWLDEHLAACADCRTIEGAYAAQQRELWALRDTMPTPPRDLWARTAAAIEAEPRFREGRKPALGWPPRRYLAPSALLAAALVVAVAVGTLTSSLRPAGDGATGSPNEVAQASTPVASARSSGGAKATPMLVAKKIEYLSRDASGAFSIKVKNVDQVCSAGSTEPCDTGSPVEDHPINLAQDTESVFGSVDKKRLIVVRDPTSSDNGTISVVPLVSPDPGATPTPTVPASASATPSPTPTSTSTPSPTPTPTAPTAPPASAPPSEEPTPTPSNEPTASVAITPAPDGTIEIAHDVVLVGQSAAYSSSGTWFAFTARPVDGSVGPDIFVWKVGEPAALPVTSDHRSIFGSWSGDIMIGSTVIDVPIAGSSAGAGSSPSADGSPSSDASATPIEHRAAAFLLDPATASVTALPQTGQAWRPAVDPSGRRAVYWDGSIRPTELGGFAPDAGRLVLGDWGTGTSAPTEGPLPTALAGDQATIRHETTISAGPIKEWDARWDRSGTHVAIWIADDKDPTVGKLFLYTVDSFDGRIDLKTPLLDGELASAGYSISEGQLVWADPGADGTPSSEVHLAAWTEQGVGTVKSVTGPVIVIR